MNRIRVVIIVSLLCLTEFLSAQAEITVNTFLKYNELYKSGDFKRAEKLMLNIVNSHEILPDGYLSAAYNNLGVFYNRLGLYAKALDCFNRAEAQIIKNSNEAWILPDVYVNKARTYTYQKVFPTAINYLEKGIRLFLNIKNPDYSTLTNISTAYLNIGIVYFSLKEYKTALVYFNKSLRLKIENNLTEKALIYLNIAKTYSQTDNPALAEEFYKKSISTFRSEFGEDHYRMSDLYFYYGLFLKSVNRNKESLDAYHKALSICLANYGEKHSLVSLSYKLIGDHFMNQNNCDSALFYFQKSIISVVNGFKNPDIRSNPNLDSVIFDIRLLDNLKSKASALEQYSYLQNDIKVRVNTIRSGLETIELSLRLIDRIRSNYLSEESRMYLAENEKETYLFAIHLARVCNELSGSDSTAAIMYGIAGKAKAAILRNEITAGKLFYSVGIPDSIRIRKDNLTAGIAAYNNLVLEESGKKEPDNKKISLWKDNLFEMNRENEKLATRINDEYPQYRKLLSKTEPLALKEIQKQLRRDETIIDYLLSNQYVSGKRKLFIFLISKNNISFLETALDSMFSKNADIIHSNNQLSSSSGESGISAGSNASALYYMYENLIRPVESKLSAKRLVIIPDEEIGLLPFDAFLRNKPSAGQTGYEGLGYLIRDYTFSFGYSSSLISTERTELKGGSRVFAFSPDYNNTGPGTASPHQLKGAGDETASILKIFRGKEFTGRQATESNFRKAMKTPAIFHLAMHSLSDSSDSKYSCLVFDKQSDTVSDGNLYNYEISLSRINSPMVVLSACNSGTGTLYHGEGLMSLARGFILAGASSVVKTAWEVNDETSAAIIKRFYFYLSNGSAKDEAMRLAKLDYIRNNPPVYSNPYYWAAYEVLGDNSPVVQKYRTSLIILIILIVPAAAALIIYFRRRRIFSARSL